MCVGVCKVRALCEVGKMSVCAGCAVPDAHFLCGQCLIGDGELARFIPKSLPRDEETQKAWHEFKAWIRPWTESAAVVAMLPKIAEGLVLECLKLDLPRKQIRLVNEINVLLVRMRLSGGGRSIEATVDGRKKYAVGPSPSSTVDTDDRIVIVVLAIGVLAFLFYKLWKKLDERVDEYTKGPNEDDPGNMVLRSGTFAAVAIFGSYVTYMLWPYLVNAPEMLMEAGAASIGIAIAAVMVYLAVGATKLGLYAIKAPFKLIQTTWGHVANALGPSETDETDDASDRAKQIFEKLLAANLDGPEPILSRNCTINFVWNPRKLDEDDAVAKMVEFIIANNQYDRGNARPVIYAVRFVTMVNSQAVMYGVSGHFQQASQVLRDAPLHTIRKELGDITPTRERSRKR